MAAAVKRGLARRGADGISFVGMDEKSFLRGKGSEAFACLMTDIDNRRVLDVARGRSEEGAKALIGKALNPMQQYMVCGVAMDMSAPFENAVRELMPCADGVFDIRNGAATRPKTALALWRRARPAGHPAAHHYAMKTLQGRCMPGCTP